MPKNNCSCGDDSQKKYKNEAETFRTHFHLDNAFIPVFRNPSRVISDLVKNTNSISLVDRANCTSCDDNVSTQEKLQVRKKNRPAPYRVPYNHYRKVTSCRDDCITNVKIIKDLSCSDIACPKTNYAISRLVDKNGVRNINNGGNYKNYLQTSGKNYYLNTAGILPENTVLGKIHTYKIGALENTVLNYNSGTLLDSNCRLNYSSTTSLTEKSFTLSKINTTTKKYSNPGFHQSGSVSSKAHLHKKKFKNILAGQSIGKNGYNNCRNGEVCTLYMKPGPNTKLFMGKTAKQRCIPPRIRGMKQTCASQPPGCESSKYLNPQFERESYITGENAGYLKISIDHCPLKVGDIIEITFSGYPTTINNIFTPNTNTNASSAITSAIFIGSNGTTNLTISNLFVNGNTLYWIMPVNIGEGTIQIIIDDGPSETNFITTNNSSTGTVYANVNVPRHISVTSSSAWNIVTPDPCAGRNGSFTQTSMILGGANDPQPPYTVVTPSTGLSHFVVMFEFTLNNDNLISGDVLQIAITTDYPAFFTNEHQDNVWTKNQRPTGSPYPTAPSIWIQTGVDGAIINDAIQTASVENTTINNVTSTYIQTLSVTIGTTISSSGSIRLGIYGNNDWLTTHPNGDYDVNYQISCNCWTSTGVLDGYNYQAPTNGQLSNLSLLPSNFLGKNRTTNSIGYTDGFQGMSQTWQRTLKGRYGYDANQISKSSFRVTLKFTITSDISTGDTIKLIMKRPYDSTLANEIFRVTNNNWTYSGQNGITMGVEYNNWNYIELKSGVTEKEISAINLGSYDNNTSSQELTLTVGENISASDICIIFYDFASVQYGAYYIAGGNWQYNVKDGTALIFDLEVTGHDTSTDNLGWYAQDITAQDSNNTTTFSSLKLFKSEDDSPTDITTIIYRHYSAIPQGSIIRLIFRTEHTLWPSGDNKYNIFKTDPNDNDTFTGASDIVNDSSPSAPGESGEGGECGIWVTSKDLNNSSTSNNITIGSFTIGGLKTSNYEPYANGGYPDTNYGSIEYLEFEVTQSGGIPGDTVTGTSAGGKYIEININARQAITNTLGAHSDGKVHYSIIVYTPYDSDYGYNLIGGAYSLEGETDGAFTIQQTG